MGVVTALKVLAQRIAEMSAASARVEGAFAALGPNDDVELIAALARKCEAAFGEIDSAVAAADRPGAELLLHRFNNTLTGALTFAAVAREETTVPECVLALSGVERAGRAVADAVHQLRLLLAHPAG